MNLLRAGLYGLGICLPLTIAGSNISWGVALAGLLLLWARGGRPRFGDFQGPVAKPLAAFIAVSLLTAWWGHNPAHSFRYIHQDVHKLWIYLLLMVGVATARDRNVHWALLAGFAAASVIGIGQSLLIPSEGGALTRAHAFVHPVTYGEQISVAFIGALCFFSCPEDLPKHPWARRGIVIFGLLTGIALVLSNTRGAMLAAAIGSAAALWHLPRWRRRIYIVAPVAVGLFLVMELVRYDRSLIKAFLNISETGITHRGQTARLVLWQVALQMGFDNPLTGVGLNNYRAALPQYFTGVFEDLTMTWGTAHNLYLHHFAERGLLGLAALGWLFWAFWKRALERVRAHVDALNLWALGTVCAFFVMNLTEVALQVEIVWMLVFWVWILAETPRPRAQSGKKHPNPPKKTA